MNPNTSKFASFILALVVLVAGLGLGLSGVAAQTDSTVLIDDRSFTPTNSTQSAYVDVKANSSASGPVAVNVTITGINEGQDIANGTVLQNEEISVGPGNVTSSTYELADTDTEFDSIVVTAEVVTAGDESMIEYADWGTVEEVAGGAGGGFGATSTTGVIAVVIALAVFVFMRDN